MNIFQSLVKNYETLKNVLYFISPFWTKTSWMLRETENWPNVRIWNWGMRNKKEICVSTVKANQKSCLSVADQREESKVAEGNNLTSQTEQSYLKYSTNVLASNKSEILQRILLQIFCFFWILWLDFHSKAFQIFCLFNTKGDCLFPLWKQMSEKLINKLNQISLEEI